MYEKHRLIRRALVAKYGESAGISVTQVNSTNSLVPCSSLDPAECGFPRGQKVFSAEGASNEFDSSEIASPSGVPDADVVSDAEEVHVSTCGWSRWAAA